MPYRPAQTGRGGGKGVDAEHKTDWREAERSTGGRHEGEEERREI